MQHTRQKETRPCARLSPLRDRAAALNRGFVRSVGWPAVICIYRMIVAAGLTPAWQKILVFDRLGVGEVNRAVEVHACASGKPINVGRAVKSLGGDVTTVIPLGGATGRAIEADAKLSDLRLRRVEVRASTRTCTTLVSRRDALCTELVEEAHALDGDELEAFAATYAQAVGNANMVILSGSLPAGAPLTTFRDLIARTPGQVIVDTRGDELIASLPLRPLLVKPNLDELAMTLGRDLTTQGALLGAMRQIVRLGARWVLTTEGSRVAWLVGESQVVRFIPPVVPCVNAIGAGDCLAAGLALGLERGLSIEDAVRFGMGAAADNVAQLLPGHLDATRARTWAAEVQVDEQTATACVQDGPAETHEAAQKVSDAGSATIPCKRLCFVGSDIYVECSAAANRMGDALGGQGEVALVGVIDAGNAEAAIKNRMFTTQLTHHYPAIQVADIVGSGKYDIKSSSYAITQRLLEQHPNLAGIYSNADEAISGIVCALRETGRDGKICLVGYGNEPHIMDHVREGIVTYALLHHRFAYGHDSIIHLYNKAVAGKTPPSKRILHMPEVVSKETIDELYNPYSGYLLNERMKRSLARPVLERPRHPLRFAILLEGVGTWFPPLIEGAREAQKILTDTEVWINNWELSGLSQEQVEHRRIEELYRAERAGVQGIVLWVLSEAIVPHVNAVVDRGTDVIVFHTEPVSFGHITPEVDEVFASLFTQLRLRESAETKLSRLSNEDELTGLFNRRRFNRYPDMEWRGLMREACSGQVRVSLIMLDIDHFKELNDTHGHLVGDDCLRVIGATIKECLRRPRDFCARYGGEEFAILLPDTDLPEAVAIAERVRASIAAASLVSRGQKISITASAGVASVILRPAGGDELFRDLVANADRALYVAKNSGRNRVESAQVERSETQTNA